VSGVQKIHCRRNCIGTERQSRVRVFRGVLQPWVLRSLYYTGTQTVGAVLLTSAGYHAVCTIKVPRQLMLSYGHLLGTMQFVLYRYPDS
jgi:hypothetical protein